ncbi:FtsX-like permease family protein [Tardisphaera saccharovorans]
MRNEFLVLLVLVLALGSACAGVEAQGFSHQKVVVLMMNYEDKVPLPGIPVRFTASGITPSTFNGTTSYNGTAALDVVGNGNIIPITSLSIGDNYTVVMVGSSEITTYNLPYGPLSTTVSYSGYYSSGFSNYEQTFEPSVASSLGPGVEELIVWAEPGKAVSVSSYDLITGEYDEPVISPALPVKGSQDFFVPMYFPLSVTAVSNLGELTPVFRVIVNQSDRYVNWSELYFAAYVNKTVSEISYRVTSYLSFGFSSFNKDKYAEILPFYEDALSYLKAGNLTAATAYFGEAQRLASSVNSAMGSFVTYAWVTTLTILALIYGLSLIVAGFVGSKGGKRIAKFMPFLFYMPLSLFVGLTQPWASPALASVLGLHLPLSAAQALFLSLAVFSLIYIVFSLLKKGIMSVSSGFITRMAMENFKRSFWRALLIIIPIAIVIASSMSIVNVSGQYGIVKTGTGVWGSGGPLLVVQPRVAQWEGENTWLLSQKWVNGSYSVFYEPSTLFIGGSSFSYVTLEVESGGSVSYLKGIYCVPPAALNSTGISLAKVVGSLPAQGAPQVLLPAGLPGVTLGSTVKLVLVLSPSGSVGTTVSYDLGMFSVSGLYQETAFSSAPSFMGKFGGSALVSVVLPGMVPKYVFIIPKRVYSVVTLAQQVSELTATPVTAVGNETWTTYDFTYVLGATHASAAVGPVLISVLLTYSFTAFFMEERKDDIRLMSTLGATPGSLAGMLLVQTLILGTVSSLLGVFGSYLMNMLESVMAGSRSASSVWSLGSLAIGLSVGLVVPVLGSLIAINRRQETKILGGPKKRVIPREARSEGDMLTYELPLKIGEEEADLLIAYLKERVIPELKGLNPELNVNESGQFSLRMDAKWRLSMGSPQRMLIRSKTEAGIMSFSMTYPPVLSDDSEFQGFLYGLERLFLEYPIWRDKTIKVTVSRRSVQRSSDVVQRRQRQRNIDEIISEIEKIKETVDEYSRKLQQLNSMKGEISPTIYEDFERKYEAGLRDALQRLRPLVEESREYADSLKKDLSGHIRMLSDMEAAKRLGEVSDEEYSAKRSAYESELQAIRYRLSMIEWAMSKVSAPD